MKTLYTNITIALLLLTSLSIKAQTTITVDNTPQSTTTHTTIQAAIDAATAGDIIYVQPSPTSYGTANIDKALTIIGRSHSELNNISTIATANIYASDVTIKGMKMGGVQARSNVASTTISNINIYECEFSGLTLGYSNTTYFLDGIVVRGCIFTGITQYITGENVLISNNIINGSSVSIYSPSTIVMSNNIFRFYTSLNIYNYAPQETFILYNNMFINNYSSGNITLSGSGDFNVSNCLTYNYHATGTSSFTGPSFLVNTTLENTDPLFTNVDSAVSTSMAGTGTYNSATRLEEDLTFQAGSPALTAGGSGTELGIFNNGFNFKYLGIPRGVPVLDIVNYDGAVAKDGNINVTISAKAH